MDLQTYSRQVEQELLGNILPFHEQYSVDLGQGGFYGRVDNDRTMHMDAPKGVVQHSRLLWSFAHAYRVYQEPIYLRLARRASEFLLDHFLDEQYGGFFWLVDAQGRPLEKQKMIYGQAFAIYGFSEYSLATGEKACLDTAVALFGLLEQKAVDAHYGGYFDAFHQDWRFTDAINVDETAVPTVKSMNTHLHMLEAYTNLLRAWDTPQLRNSLLALIRIMLTHIIDRKAGQMRLHFSAEWQSLTDHMSYGHDIEASWLLVEAAELLGDEELSAEVEQVALHMAQIAYDEGLVGDGSLRDDDQSADKTWWVQAEAMVGFLNAYQLSGKHYFLEASLGCWHYVQETLLDRRYGEWIWGLDGDGSPIPRAKAGLWKAPYHNGRACMEIKKRVAGK